MSLSDKLVFARSTFSNDDGHYAAFEIPDFKNCREIKADLADGSKPSTSDLPLYCSSGHLMSPFNIDDTPNVGVGSFENKNNETEEPKADDVIIKDGTKAKLSDVSLKGNKKGEKHSKTRLILQDRLIAAAKDSLHGLDDPGHAYI